MQAAVWLLEPVVERHQEQLRRQAIAYRTGRQTVRPHRRPGTRRERLGWLLVELGLRLALTAEARADGQVPLTVPAVLAQSPLPPPGRPRRT